MSIIERATTWLRAGRSGDRELLLGQAKVELAAIADGNKPATVRVVAYTGSVMQLGGWGNVVIELAAIQLPERLPLLIDHANLVEAIAGSGVPSIEGGQLIIAGQLARGTEAADKVIALGRASVPLGASVGMSVQRTQYIEAGKKVSVNGKTFTAGRDGLTVVRAATLREVSFVAIGGDPQAGVSSLAATKRKTKMASDITTQQDDDQTLEAAELHRQDQIKALFARHDDIEKVEDPHSGRIVAASTYKKNSLKRGDDPLAVRAALLESRLANGADTLSRPAIHMMPGTAQAPDLHAQAFSCALLRGRFGAPASFERAGKRFGVEEMFSEQVLELADHAELRNPSLSQLMDATIRQAGDFYAGNRKSDGFIKQYVRSAKSLEAAGGGPFSTLTVGNILEDAANKQLLMRFQMAEPVWPQISKQVPVDDFKPAKLYRLDENLGYVKVNAQGELTSGQLSDSKRTVQADTYGRMISISRQHIYNDDLQAFTQIVNGLADGSIWAIESAVATVLLENSGSFFSVGNKNLITDVLSLDGLEAAEINFASHVGAGGKPINFPAATLLTGTTLGVTARNILAAAPLLSVDANQSNVVVQNPFAGKYKPVPWPYLNNTDIKTPEGDAIPNQSSTAWFLLSDPAMGSVIAVALLSGSAAPTIQSSDTSFDTLGMQWRGFHDFGVGQADEEYGVMSSGDESGS